MAKTQLPHTLKHEENYIYIQIYSNVSTISHQISYSTLNCWNKRQSLLYELFKTTF